MSAPIRGSGLLVLAVASASVVMAEVLFTRLLSVTTWYALAFLVLSIAMLGITRGSLDAASAHERGEPLVPWIARRLAWFAVGLVFATIVTLSVPLTFTPNLTSLGALLVVIAACTAPIIAAGGVVARLMAESHTPLATLYAVDLVAAAVGAVLPLAILGPMSGPHAIVAVGFLSALLAYVLAEKGHKSFPSVVAIGCAAIVAIGQYSNFGLVLKYAKGAPRTGDAAPLFEAWNPLSYVSLTGFAPANFPLWSGSPSAPSRVQPVAMAVIDGEAATAVYAYRTIAQLDLLKWDAITTAHALRPDGTACVIGIGGGRDLESAVLFGHDRVVGVEINPSMVTMLDRVSQYSPILKDPRVEVIIGDGRAEFARRDIHCRVLQASLVDTWAATSAGAFSHTESTLYTREAWSIFLKRVEPEGIVTFSRWFDPTHVNETSRLVSLAVASLIDRGITHPRDHIALVAAARVATILVSPSPFSADDITKLNDWVKQYGFVLVFAPGTKPADPILNGLLASSTIDDLTPIGYERKIDTSPPTDDRPFFFQLLSIRAWLHPTAVTHESGADKGALSGNVASTFELLLTLIGVAIAAAVLLGPTLIRASHAAVPPLPCRRANIYFAALGGGFMLAEIALVQRMHVVLGHPTYALVVVLAGLLVSTGIGSALSPFLIRSRRHVAIAALVAAALIAAMPWAIIHPLVSATQNSPFWVRIVWTGGCAALVGVVLGTMFPSGLRFVDREQAAPVALALNGATSVVGSVIAVMLSVWLGIPASFVAAAAIYVIVALTSPVFWPELPRAQSDVS